MIHGRLLIVFGARQAIILPGNFIYIGISIVGAKLYANSVLAVYVCHPSMDYYLIFSQESSLMLTVLNR